jgi:hypothetical protein
MGMWRFPATPVSGGGAPFSTMGRSTHSGYSNQRAPIGGYGQGNGYRGGYCASGTSGSHAARRTYDDHDYQRRVHHGAQPDFCSSGGAVRRGNGYDGPQSDHVDASSSSHGPPITPEYMKGGSLTNRFDSSSAPNTDTTEWAQTDRGGALTAARVNSFSVLARTAHASNTHNSDVTSTDTTSRKQPETTWSAAEDRILSDAVNEIDADSHDATQIGMVVKRPPGRGHGKWARVAAHFPGKSESAVKNRWFRRFGDQSTRNVPPVVPLDRHGGRRPLAAVNSFVSSEQIRRDSEPASVRRSSKSNVKARPGVLLSKVAAENVAVALSGVTPHSRPTWPTDATLQAGAQGRRVSETLPSLSASESTSFPMETGLQALVSMRWSSRQDEILRNLVHEYGAKTWGVISARVTAIEPGETVPTASQAMQRWSKVRLVHLVRLHLGPL